MFAMRLPRLRVRMLLIAVALMAVMLGGSLEALRLSRLSQKYAELALGYGGNVRMRMSDLAKSDARREQLREDLAARPSENESDGRVVGIYQLMSEIRYLRADIAANANLVQIYEHAASHPWEMPPRATETTGPVETFPFPKLISGRPPHRPPGVNYGQVPTIGSRPTP